jgi:predicted XRE-type DNA-binding protein
VIQCVQKKTAKTRKADLDLAAKLFCVTQPRVSGLMRGKINLFGLDALVNMAATAGLHIEMRGIEAA